LAAGFVLMKKRVFFSLGSNMGEREAELQNALNTLHFERLRVTKLSSLYETEPQDVKQQPLFLNLVAEAETEMFPLQVLARIAVIEREMGRRRVQPKGPRNIDIDILLFGNFVVDTPKLTIPHARMHERRFVLEPLAELAPTLRHPVTKRTVKEMLAAAAPGQLVRRIGRRLDLPVDFAQH
jgi:2-amino-4-hydroxy-6-hydroxymethyldihydropteridine diphosphokinase